MAISGSTAPSPLHKKAYLEKAEATLQLWRARLSEMEAWGQELNEDMRPTYEEERQLMQHRIEKAAEAVSLLQGAGDDTWDDARTRVEYFWEALEDIWAYWTDLLKKEDRRRKEPF